MPNNKDHPDIIEGNKRYIYSHTDEIIVVNKIWKRHIYFIQRASTAWQPEVGGTGCLLFFTPTNEPAPEQHPANQQNNIREHIKKYGDNP